MKTERISRTNAARKTNPSRWFNMRRKDIEVVWICKAHLDIRTDVALGNLGKLVKVKKDKWENSERKLWLWFMSRQMNLPWREFPLHSPSFPGSCPPAFVLLQDLLPDALSKLSLLPVLYLKKYWIIPVLTFLTNREMFVCFFPFFSCVQNKIFPFEVKVT